MLLRISSDNELIIPFEQGVQTLRHGQEMQISDLKILINGDFLVSLTERITCVLKIELLEGENVLALSYKDVTALAYDEWPGMKYFPDFLAAYVTPNHPVIAELLQSTSKWLEKWTHQPSLEGYQCQSPNRVKTMAAVYAAIQERNITYANPPSSFETLGQRVRLCDTVMEQQLGTCMDMTLLYASVLEAIGLNPVLVLMNGHIFAGVWLVDQSFADPLEEDPSQLEKRMATGIHELIVVECTAMCAGKTYNFETAVKMAEENVGKYGEFQFAIDVMRARHSGVRQLPVRVKGANTLYLALGLLRWFEKKTEEEVPRYAPIVLIPIDIIRKSASKGYTMRMRDEDAQINITMLEFLKQNYGIVIGGLNPIPTDEHGLDMKKIFAIIHHAVIDETMWDVVESGFIGNFWHQWLMYKEQKN